MESKEPNVHVPNFPGLIELLTRVAARAPTPPRWFISRFDDERYAPGRPPECPEGADKDLWSDILCGGSFGRMRARTIAAESDDPEAALAVYQPAINYIHAWETAQDRQQIMYSQKWGGYYAQQLTVSVAILLNKIGLPYDAPTAGDKPGHDKAWHWGIYHLTEAASFATDLIPVWYQSEDDLILASAVGPGQALAQEYAVREAKFFAWALTWACWSFVSAWESLIGAGGPAGDSFAEAIRAGHPGPALLYKLMNEHAEIVEALTKVENAQNN